MQEKNSDIVFQIPLLHILIIKTMAKYVCMGAMLKCSFGMAPSTLMVTVPLRPMIQNKFKANIMDFAPMMNIMPFGMCQSMANQIGRAHV